jgi:hypothetical protein
LNYGRIFFFTVGHKSFCLHKREKNDKEQNKYKKHIIKGNIIMAKRVKQTLPIGTLLVLAIVVFLYLLYTRQPKPVQPVQAQPMPSEIQVVVAQDYTDTLKNVYVPPVRYHETEFRQLGYLTSPQRDRIPLFGRQLNRRDKWAYYTLEQGIKLPIEYQRRMCTQSPGCDSLSSGDEVHVEKVPYKVTLYESFLSSY